MFGKSRQAYYDTLWHKKEREDSAVLVLEMIVLLRREMPKLGTRKLYYMLESFLKEHKIKIGRDRLHSLLLDHGLILQRNRKYFNIPYSSHWLKKYPNLVKDMIVLHPEQLWVSDITYISLIEGFGYLSLVTDAYSRLIVGYCLHPTLESRGCINALQMALESRKTANELIHHSDRGIQYCSSSYINILETAGLNISMTKGGSPHENALAERVNGILKNELGLNKIFDDIHNARVKVDKAIAIYNDKRPHASVNYLTPSLAHLETGELKKRWKEYECYKKPT